MRHRVRIQPYISPELCRKLRAYSAARELTDSAVTEAALSEYLGREDVEEALVLRRFDGVTQGIARLQRDVDILSQTFGTFVRFMLFAPPADRSREAGQRAQNLFAQLLAQVSRDIDAGVRLTGLVDRARERAAVQRQPGAMANRSEDNDAVAKQSPDRKDE